MTVKDIRILTGMTQVEFAKQYHIPKRTIEDWERGATKPPAYVVELLERVVRMDFSEQG